MLVNGSCTSLHPIPVAPRALPGLVEPLAATEPVPTATLPFALQLPCTPPHPVKFRSVIIDPSGEFVAPRVGARPRRQRRRWRCRWRHRRSRRRRRHDQELDDGTAVDLHQSGLVVPRWRELRAAKVKEVLVIPDIKARAAISSLQQRDADGLVPDWVAPRFVIRLSERCEVALPFVHPKSRTMARRNANCTQMREAGCGAGWRWKWWLVRARRQQQQRRQWRGR